MFFFLDSFVFTRSRNYLSLIPVRVSTNLTLRSHAISYTRQLAGLHRGFNSIPMTIKIFDIFCWKMRPVFVFGFGGFCLWSIGTSGGCGS